MPPTPARAILTAVDDVTPPLRPLAPTGALGVGDPPVAAHAVVSVERRRDEDALAAARRAFPHLSADEVQAALAQRALDPAPLTPRPGWADALWLALPLGAGMQLLACAATAVLGLVSLVGASHAQDDGVSGASDGALALLLVAGLFVVAGVGLLRLEPWARLGGALLGAALVARAALGEGDATAYVGAMGLGWVALIASPIGRWTTTDGRAARGAVATRPFLQAALWSWVVLGALVLIVPAFHRMFREVGVTLPPLTEVTLRASSLLVDWQALLPPLHLLASLPLLRLQRRHERPASLAIDVLGVAVLGTLLGALALPGVEIFQKL